MLPFTQWPYELVYRLVPWPPQFNFIRDIQSSFPYLNTLRWFPSQFYWRVFDLQRWLCYSSHGCDLTCTVFPALFGFIIDFQMWQYFLLIFTCNCSHIRNNWHWWYLFFQIDQTSSRMQLFFPRLVCIDPPCCKFHAASTSFNPLEVRPVPKLGGQNPLQNE